MSPTAEPHRGRPRPRAQHLLRILVLASALLATGCFGLVVEPAEDAYVTGNVEVWGYSVASGGQVEVQAHDRVANTWRTLRTTTASATRTYAGTASGYYFRTSVARAQLSGRYRYPGPLASLRTVRLRVVMNGQEAEPALTREYSRGEVWSSLNDLWNKVQADNRGVIEVTIPN